MIKKNESKSEKNNNLLPLLFDKSNYVFFLISVLLVIGGCLLMIGGRNDNPNEFNYNEIFSFRRITLAPLCIMLGFVVAIYAILKKPKNTNQE